MQKTIADLKSRARRSGRAERPDRHQRAGTAGAEAAAASATTSNSSSARPRQPQRVGDITLLLKKTDPKKNKYTVEVMADDKLTEKKDKNINEPVQFYTAKGGRIPTKS